MHPLIFEQFERICAPLRITGSVLEVGAVPADDTLLCLSALRDAKEKVGVNLLGPSKYRDFEIRRGDANSMDFLQDNSFDLVISNATLEHDFYFWRSVSEMKRVLKPGGALVIGVPGFVKYPIERLQSRFANTFLGRLAARHPRWEALITGTVTFKVHLAPRDFYRFSEYAVRDVLFENMQDVTVKTAMSPPRLIGLGFKPKPAA